MNKNEGKKGGRGGRQVKERAVRRRKKREVMNNDEQQVTTGIGQGKGIGFYLGDRVGGEGGTKNIRRIEVQRREGRHEK